MKKILFIIGLFIIHISALKAQNSIISGRILDEQSGQPLEAATISVKDTRTTALTNPDGRFFINANPGQVLIISFLGYTEKSITVTPELQNLVISLSPDAENLSEVIVTGALGLKRPARELGGGAQIVSNGNLNQGKTVNPLFGLSSKVAGLRINMYDSKIDPAIQITLRGSRSLSRTSGIDGRNPNAPLYVVDGIPVPDIGRLNPNDIESITVLKGANAAALYGSEGVNGALMVTTKSGKKGRNTVNFSNTTTFSQVHLLPPAQTRYGQGVNGVYDPIQHESWGPEFDGTMRDFGTPLPDGSQPQLLFAAPEKDNRLNMFETGMTVQNDISFSGGDERSTYFLSAQHVSAKGIIPEDENNRTGLRFNGSRNFGKLTARYNINYIYNKKSIAPDGPWITSYQLPANIDYGVLENWQDESSLAHPRNFFTDALKNPYFQIDNYRNNSEQQIINGKVELNYTVSPAFEILYRVGMYSLTDETRNTTGKLEAPGRRNVNGSVSDGNDSYRRINSDLILSFKKDFGDFSTRLVLGQNARADNKKETSIGSSNLLYPEVFNPGSRTGELNGSVSLTQYRSFAAYGEFVTGYKNYLFLTLTGRNDWVSVLSPENRSYFYPGISSSFIFSEALEPLKNSSVLSFGKLFASWNKTGNVTLLPYQLNNTYSQSNGFPFGNLVGFTPGTTNPNPNIQPEFVTSFEAGIQLGLFNNRVNLDASYIFSDSKGQIFNATTSRATGYSSARVNAGQLTNNIIELSLSGDVVRSRDLIWNMGFTFTYINNQVKELYEGLTNINNFRQSYAIIGEAYPSLQVSDYKRDDAGRVVVDQTTGDPIVATDNTLLGTMVPPYQMGLSQQIRFKGFSLGAQFDWRMGGWLYSEIVPRMYNAGTDPRTAEYDREPFVWPNSVIEVEPGKFEPNTNLTTSSGGRAFWSKQGEVQINTAAKSDFFKLRELNLSYTVPDRVLSNQNVFQGATVGLVATNLFIIRNSKNNYGDPEYLYNNTDGYLSFRMIPPYRTYGFYVNVNF